MTGTDASEQTEELQIETLSGELRDALLMRVRDMKRPWSLLTEQEQREMAEGLDMAARHLVRNAVRLLNNFEWPHAVVKLHEIKIAGGDKGIEAKINAANLECNRSVLGENVGTYCMLLMVDSDTFMAERGPAAVDPDQPELPGGDESEAA